MRSSSLRRTLTAALVVLGTLSTIVALALVLSTTIFQTIGDRRASALENVRIAQDAERELLIHDRTNDPVVRHELAAELDRELADVRSIGTPEDRDLIARTERAVAAYLRAPYGSVQAEALHAEADAFLKELVHSMLARAHEAERSQRRWDDVSGVLGSAVFVIVIFATAALIWWIQVRALRPLFDLADAMRRFGSGDLLARAEEAGPGELREMATRFNEMARAIGRQRQHHTAFVAGVAHDVRTPLNALRLASDLVAPDAPLPPEERIRSVLALVQRQVTRLERLVGDFLDASALEAGELQLRLARHDVVQVARAAVSLFDGASTLHRIDVVAPARAVLTTCDAVRLEEVIANLVGNAIKYSPEGGRVTLEIIEQAAVIDIDVADEGIGMSKAEIEVAFEPFSRPGSRRVDIAGHGLGLFVVKRLVVAHGGRIEVKSEPGKGTRVTVSLPR